MELNQGCRQDAKTPYTRKGVCRVSTLLARREQACFPDRLRTPALLDSDCSVPGQRDNSCMANRAWHPRPRAWHEEARSSSASSGAGRHQMPEASSPDFIPCSQLPRFSDPARAQMDASRHGGREKGFRLKWTQHRTSVFRPLPTLERILRFHPASGSRSRGSVDGERAGAWGGQQGCSLRRMPGFPLEDKWG